MACVYIFLPRLVLVFFVLLSWSFYRVVVYEAALMIPRHGVAQTLANAVGGERGRKGAQESEESLDVAGHRTGLGKSWGVGDDYMGGGIPRGEEGSCRVY
jgi:hypothetical protein